MVIVGGSLRDSRRGESTVLKSFFAKQKKGKKEQENKGVRGGKGRRKRGVRSWSPVLLGY